MLLTNLYGKVCASPINYTTLLITGFTSETNQWSKVGYTPYLTLQDQPTHFIFTNTYPITDAKYTLQDIDSTKKTLVSVEIRVYHRIDATGGQQWIKYYIWDGSSYVTDRWWGVAYGDSGWVWTGWDDITFDINTWDKVNDLAIKVESNIMSGGPFGIANYVDCIEVRVGWESIVAWEDVESWYGTLSTKEWLNAESWFGNILTRKFFTAEIWRGIAGTIVYNLVEIWKGTLIFGTPMAFYVKVGLFGSGMALMGFVLIMGSILRSKMSKDTVVFLLILFVVGAGFMVGGASV